MIKKGNHSLHALGTWDQAGAENVEVWDHTDNNSPVKLIPVKEEAVKENHPMKLVPDKKEEAVGNNTDPVRLNPAMVEAVGGNHPVKLISAKKEAVKENTFSEQLIPVKEEVVKENYPEKENQPKDAVQKIPVELRDADEDINNPARLRDALKENQMKDSANNEGGHALKSLLPDVKGGTLHGATDAGGEASQIESTSFEVLTAVGGGHALLGARPDDVGHQGVSLPHHTGGGTFPTNRLKTVKRNAEQP